MYSGAAQESIMAHFDYMKYIIKLTKLFYKIVIEY